MAQQISDRRDIDFVLFEQMQVEDLAKTEKFAEFNKKTIDMIINEARNLAVKEILPTNQLGDREGCEFDNGKVKVPESFHRIFELYREGEWIAMSDDPAVGGQGMPVMVQLSAMEYFTGANCAFMMYPGICHGAAKVIEIFGTDKQKEMFLEKMYTGQWGGSMVLTEPDAGSDVGALTTTARRNGDGTFEITGSKIFITAGDQDLTENIIHPVLARIEGAPAGTKGISLFIVPKIWVNEDGTMGEDNDIVCTGIEEKMGIHGSCTCSLSFGSKNKCRGLLLGEENKGMRAMFHLMNEARLGVGIQAFAMGSAAYIQAVNYAKERKQGRHLLQMMDTEAPPVAIIEHPDIRRMLLSMKAYVDGMRSMIYFAGNCFDKEQLAETEEEKAYYQGFVEILTPIAKAYCSERAFEITRDAMQVHGGYGYTQEYPVEQYLRDCKITSIYEGTNGIQAMDLLGRKMAMKGGKPFQEFIGLMNREVQNAREVEGLSEMADKVEAAVKKLGDTAMNLGTAAMSDKLLTAFSHAHPFLEITGDVCMAWMHLWRARSAMPKLIKLAGGADPAKRKEKAEKNKDAAFYEGVIQTTTFFMNNILPVTMGKMDAVNNLGSAAVDIPVPSFGG